jgi:hypothetical protein
MAVNKAFTSGCRSIAINCISIKLNTCAIDTSGWLLLDRFRGCLKSLIATFLVGRSPNYPFLRGPGGSSRF